MRLSGKFIKHKSFKDVFFEVAKVLELPHKFIITGYWHNQAFVESYSLHCNKQTLKILKEDLKNWLYCTDPGAKCVRYSYWASVK